MLFDHPKYWSRKEREAHADAQVADGTAPPRRLGQFFWFKKKLYWTYDGERVATYDLEQFAGIPTKILDPHYGWLILIGVCGLLLTMVIALAIALSGCQPRPVQTAVSTPVSQTSETAVRVCFRQDGHPLAVTGLGTFDGECMVTTHAEAMSAFVKAGHPEYEAFLEQPYDICVDADTGYVSQSSSGCANAATNPREQPDDPDGDGVAHGIIGVTTVESSGTAYWKPVINGPDGDPEGHHLSEYSVQLVSGKLGTLDKPFLLHSADHVVFDAYGQRWSLVDECFGLYDPTDDLLNAHGRTAWMETCGEQIVTDFVCEDYPDSPLCEN